MLFPPRSPSSDCKPETPASFLTVKPTLVQVCIGLEPAVLGLAQPATTNEPHELGKLPEFSKLLVSQP